MNEKPRLCMFVAGYCLFLSAMLLLPCIACAQGVHYPPGIVSYWKFDDRFGSTAMDSAGISDGEIIGGATWTDGIVGGALLFDGNSYVLLPDSQSLKSLTSITIEAWIKCDEFGGAIISTEKAASYALELSGSQLIFVPPFYPYEWFGSPPPPLTNGSWFHVAGMLDASTAEMKIYLNGAEVARGGLGNWNHPEHTYATIGISARVPAWGDQTTGFKGIIDELAVYNRALLPQEIQQHFQDGLLGFGYIDHEPFCKSVPPGFEGDAEHSPPQ